MHKNIILCLYVESDGVICTVKALQTVNVSARLGTDGQNKSPQKKRQCSCWWVLTPFGRSKLDTYTTGYTEKQSDLVFSYSKWKKFIKELKNRNLGKMYLIFKWLFNKRLISYSFTVKVQIEWSSYLRADAESTQSSRWPLWSAVINQMRGNIPGLHSIQRGKAETDQKILPFSGSAEAPHGGCCWLQALTFRSPG